MTTCSPTDVGAGHLGAGLGPEALRIAGLGESLVARGVDVVDRGNLDGPRNPWTAPVQGYRHLNEVVEWNRAVFDAVRDELRQGRLVAGADGRLDVGDLGVDLLVELVDLRLELLHFREGRLVDAQLVLVVGLQLGAGALQGLDDRAFQHAGQAHAGGSFGLAPAGFGTDSFVLGLGDGGIPEHRVGGAGGVGPACLPRHRAASTGAVLMAAAGMFDRALLADPDYLEQYVR